MAPFYPHLFLVENHLPETTIFPIVENIWVPFRKWYEEKGLIPPSHSRAAVPRGFWGVCSCYGTFKKLSGHRSLTLSNAFNCN